MAKRRFGVNDHLETVNRVLVVDDERDTVELVIRMLRDHYQVIGSTSAAEAIGWLEEQRFEVVLVDQRLRDGTGTSLLARCAEMLPLCRRVAMSGKVDIGDLLAAINVAKVSRFVLKPFSRETLLSMLAGAMAEYEAERVQLEQFLIERTAAAGERRHVAEKRPGQRRRSRGRPSHWPTGPNVRAASPEDRQAIVALFNPDLDLALASLRPDAALDPDQADEWSAELELRLVTRLRDTDQAFRLPGYRFVLAFARTGKDGARRACRRLAVGLPGGLRIDLVAWPGDSDADPSAVVDWLLGA
jgi:CheY-like chemotaxis protein